MRKSKVSDKTFLLTLLNFLLLIFLFLTNLNKQTINKTIFLSNSERGDSKKELKKSICKEAFLKYKQGDPVTDLFHPEIAHHLLEEKRSEFSMKGIDQVFVEMISKDECRVILKRKTGFSGLNAIITKDGPLGLRITTLKNIKLKLHDVRTYL